MGCWYIITKNNSDYTYDDSQPYKEPVLVFSMLDIQTLHFARCPLTNADIHEPLTEPHQHFQIQFHRENKFLY